MSSYVTLDIVSRVPIREKDGHGKWSDPGTESYFTPPPLFASACLFSSVRMHKILTASPQFWNVEP